MLLVAFPLICRCFDRSNTPWRILVNSSRWFKWFWLPKDRRGSRCLEFLLLDYPLSYQRLQRPLDGPVSDAGFLFDQRHHLRTAPGVLEPDGYLLEQLVLRLGVLYLVVGAEQDVASIRERYVERGVYGIMAASTSECADVGPVV